MRDDGNGESLQLEVTDHLEPMRPARADERPGQVAHEDLGGRGRGFESGRFHHWFAMTVVGDELHVACTDPDPQHEVFGRRTVDVVGVGGLLGVDRGVDRVACRVEHGHDAVARSFDDGAVMALDDLAQQVVEAQRETVGVVVAAAG